MQVVHLAAPVGRGPRATRVGPGDCCGWLLRISVRARVGGCSSVHFKMYWGLLLCLGIAVITIGTHNTTDTRINRNGTLAGFPLGVYVCLSLRTCADQPGITARQRTQASRGRSWRWKIIVTSRSCWFLYLARRRRSSEGRERRGSTCKATTKTAGRYCGRS